MKTMNVRRRLVAAAMALGLVTALAACGDDDSDSGGSGGGSGDKDITVGIIEGWTDYTSMGYMWKNLLEADGYNVEIKSIPDNGPMYAAVAKGDIDMMASGWPEVTQKQYWDQYQDDLEDLDTWYDNAKLTLAVPTYTDIDSIDELADNADMFDSTITGIEAGAGLTGVVKDSVIPEYGLDDYELQTSSTTAMLAELKKATDAKEDLLVTLWRPFWANTAFPVKDLEDPKGALGDPEGLHVLARSGFSDDYPEIADMIGKAKMDDEQYGSLEDLVANKYADDPAKAIDEWLKANPDWAKTLQG
ncbi:glycine betaine ABC transporter substrate-binding protein [Solicola gregarius]|uniref:Glycine betaine ABC transporter substrate-binding protein n=1 Tax=Solicola gregarius TaxID=2908642 RepID=A0AA46TFH0_9ACTN|nr:glycine betaine ABC transporter substrate-binding protein [Solicola gregarius]UYM04387.1 glycine betaine ABC transporter substrate-binding protein [Solicola gregarius]